MATIETSRLTIRSKGTLPRVPFERIKNAILGKEYDLSVTFLSPVEALALNIAHRGKDYTPNTLSFPLTKTSGEIIICRSVARTQYKDFNLSYDDYLTFLFIHSALHLKGYEHGSTMERKEKEFLKLFSAPNGKITHQRRH
ncbi:rRNA maturation RNase YbeY [Candidatus Nomurabacteria bacterium]|nr:rRNA maturation RNase YbeY [Candidatus Nomurabacteria bacterium]